MPRTLEADLERYCLDLLKGEGYQHFPGDSFDPDAVPGERTSFHDVVLHGRFRTSIARLNPTVPHDAVDRAANAVLDQHLPEVLAENRRVHRLLLDGVPVEYQRGAETMHDRVRLVDWTDTANDWFVVDQYTVVGSSKRRPDLVLFLNGLPLVVIELKAAETEAATTRSAYNQLQTYKKDIPALFRTNLLGVISDGLSARFGTISADYDRFMAWRTVDGVKLESPTGTLAIETLIRGLLRREVLLNELRFFTVFEDDGTTTIKKVAGYHQYHAAMKGLRSTKAALTTGGKGGVVWHTQGSGKSLLMAFFGGMLVHDPVLGNPTLLVLTDRNDLDTQLFSTFSRCKELFGQDPEQVEKVSELRSRLDRQVGGVVFATIQKFRPDDDGQFPELTQRKNVIVFVDEAHRSQYGFAAKMDVATGVKSYGFAHYVRKGLPKATFIGFTGTPVELVDKNTKDVFGNYIDIYDIARAVEDKATVPIHYEGKIVRLTLDETEANTLNEEFEDVTDDLEEEARTRYSQRWSQLEALAGTERRLDELAKLVVEHFERRQSGMLGKGMVVCMSRRICAELYERIAKLRPEWHDPADERGAMKVVMTGAASDPQEMQPHIRSKTGLDLLARRFRDPKDGFQLVIVRDMWLTGFDSPSMHTLYIDKPMKGHNLMQAIARVNRIFRDKPAGLVVDTIGVATELKAALSFYSAEDRDLTGVDIEQAVGALLDALCVMRTLFHGFDYQ
ncbi:MAG: type I restriction endonuclease subunit R, partial [Verrucomicrobiota bacterium]